MDTAARFWDRAAPSYARAPIRDTDAYETTLARTRAHLRPADRVIEFGCGTGTTAVSLAGDAGHVLATDISEAMLAIGRRRAAEAGAENVAFAQRDVRAEPGEAFDVALAFNLLHLLPDPAASVREMAAALRPGGTLIVKATCLADPGLGWRYRAMLLGLPVMQWLGRAPAVTFLRVAELDAAVQAAGLEIVETGVYPASPPNRFVVARKPAA